MAWKYCTGPPRPPCTARHWGVYSAQVGCSLLVLQDAFSLRKIFLCRTTLSRTQREYSALPPSTLRKCRIKFGIVKIMSVFAGVFWELYSLLFGGQCAICYAVFLNRWTEKPLQRCACAQTTVDKVYILSVIFLFHDFFHQKFSLFFLISYCGGLSSRAVMWNAEFKAEVTKETILLQHPLPARLGICLCSCFSKATFKVFAGSLGIF